MTGLPATGKSTVAALLNKVFGIQSVNLGDVLRQHLQTHGIQCESRQEIGPTFLKQHSERAIFHLALEAAQKGGAAVFDGIRFAVTCNQFRLSSPGVRIWYLETDSSLREKRLHRREWERLPSSTRDYADQQLIVRGMANTIISNNNSLEKLKAAVQKHYVEARLS